MSARPGGWAQWKGRENTGGKVDRSQTLWHRMGQGRGLGFVLGAAAGHVGFSTGSQVTNVHVRKFTGCRGGSGWGRLSQVDEEEAAAGIEVWTGQGTG